MNYVKFTPISIKGHPELNEKWIQDRIADDPQILGLQGEVILKARERTQPKAGRLDLLLQDADASRRYEVEIQLGATDESHLVRTIEYWDIERKRHPEHDHVAVIIAEDITSRFLNVISLFNGVFPLIAIQMKCLKLEESYGLVFTTVLDLFARGLVDDDEDVQEVATRDYWESKGTKKTVGIADQILEFARTLDPTLEMKYNKFYIGIAKQDKPFNFLTFRPKKKSTQFGVKLKYSQELNDELENAALDVMEYDSRHGYYRIRLKPGDYDKHAENLSKIIEHSFRSNNYL